MKRHKDIIKKLAKLKEVFISNSILKSDK